MAQLISSKMPVRCLRNVFLEAKPQMQQSRRNIVTIQRGPVQKLNLPPNLPEQYWSQLPKRLRPDRAQREIVIHEPPPSERAACKEPIAVIDAQQLALLDPSGARARLFDQKNPDGAKPGDILLTTFKTGEPFSGVIISIKSRGPHTAVLVRNHLTRVGTEMQIKVFSPLVQSMEVAQKATKRARRARLYYLRKPEHDVGSVQKTVDQYLRQRAILTGGGRTGAQQGSRPKKGKR